MNNTLWIVASDTAEFGRVYLADYTGRDKAASERKVMGGARREGFSGSVSERLRALGWEIVCIRFDEVQPNTV